MTTSEEYAIFESCSLWNGCPFLAAVVNHPNLLLDLSIGHDTVIRSESDRQIPEKWRILYEKHVDRIMIGVDTQTRKGFEAYY